MSWSGPRTFVSVLLALAACALTVVALLAGWVHRELIDTDRWTQTSVEVLRDPAVQEVTAAYLADELVAQAEAAGGVGAALPPSLQGLAVAATPALHALAERTALTALRNRAFEDLWSSASRTTHEQFLRWMAGQDSTVNGNAVELDLQPALVRLARRVGVPENVIATGVDANVKIIGSGEYEQSRQKARALEQTATAALILAVLAALLSLWIAKRRLWALARLGAAAAVAGGFVLVFSPSLGTWVIDELTGNGTATAVADAIWRLTEPDLTHLAWITVIAGGTVALLAGGAAALREPPPA